MSNIQKLTNTNQKEGMIMLQSAIRQNGYSNNNITRALRPRRPITEKFRVDKPIAKAYLPYVKRLPVKIAKALKKNKCKNEKNTEKPGNLRRSWRDCHQTNTGQTNQDKCQKKGKSKRTTK